MAGKHDFTGLTATERAAFADLVADLGEEDMRRESLCAGWSTRDVACHVASCHRTGLGRALAGIVLSGFDPDRFNEREVRAWRARSDAEIVEAIAEPKLKGVFKLSPAGALTEIFLHQQDVRRPTGVARAYSPACLAAALDATVTATTGTGSKKRVRGLALRATDIDWSHGSGAEVSGPAEALIMAANGRVAAAGELGGEGLETLRGRLAPAPG